MATRRDQVVGTLRGAALFGPRYLRLLRATTSTDHTVKHEAERDWLRSAERAIELVVEAHGLDKVDPEGQYIVLPLHEGLTDVLALAHLPLDLTYSATEELFEWKLLGRYLKASGQSRIPVPAGPSAFRTMMRDAEAAFRARESYVVFPQGSILGIEVAFNKGAFHLSARTGRPILPVVLTGSANVWQHPYASNLNFGQTIRVEVLDPIEASDVLGRADEIESDMKTRALHSTPSPRRFDPKRDGWWDDYPYEIDPAFTELAQLVAEHRATV